ncbi:MBL fold metallo-hydrolase [Pseudoflavonifractor sp. AF19-9AC]|uniref:MBL fold metallo-hydrolase n=1 Tax=Pseudoflavonifractor sp. AF19-9AC TaxID=2292244 RepID=UPI000E532C7E|nr:MBL fold metallo-hydrolase [Pseudoflavonifractor sp. AF19-9AC]RHR10776.1 MBL fold metallo-hydrolase [Pseudoflavonifractor sp. AF19-9AC]
MKLSQVKGNTWVAEGMELIPFYKLDEHRCILLDTGLLSEREELEGALLDQGLTPAGILCSHAHVDHCGNSGYFQQKYRIPVALTAPEAAMCQNVLTLKCYFLTLSPDTVERESACMIHTPDVILPPEDGPFSFAGAEFTLIHTPGHSAGHVCTVTPDGVCYLADAVLSHELLGAKLPYNLSQAMAMDSREKLRGLPYDTYIMAHHGVCTGEELPHLLDANQSLIRTRAEEIRALIPRPMTLSQIDAAVCAYYQLFTHKPNRALRFERNIRFFVEYLVDRGLLEVRCRGGVALYGPPSSQAAAQ